MFGGGGVFRLPSRKHVQQTCASSPMITVGRLTEGFYDTRPQRNGRCRCHEDCTKCSRLEHNSRGHEKGTQLRPLSFTMCNPLTLGKQLRNNSHTGSTFDSPWRFRGPHSRVGKNGFEIPSGQQLLLRFAQRFFFGFELIQN